MSPVIQTSQLTKSYGPLLALKGLDLSVERGTGVPMGPVRAPR